MASKEEMIKFNSIAQLFEDDWSGSEGICLDQIECILKSDVNVAESDAKRGANE